MEGLTQFEKATEYFILKRDSRVFNLSFTYRFGKAYKTTKRSAGSAGDEIDRQVMDKSILMIPILRN